MLTQRHLDPLKKQALLGRHVFQQQQEAKVIRKQKQVATQ